MRNQRNKHKYCEFLSRECDKYEKDSSHHHNQWYEIACRIKERECPKVVPIDTTLPTFLILSFLFMMVFRLKTSKPA